MNRTLKMSLLSVVVIAAMIFAYRIVFIRTVNYEIGGIKIPSRYNVLTGKVTPLINYKGADIKKTVADNRVDKVGMSGEEVTLAQFRWAMFEQWVKARPKYKGWESDPEIFKAANEAFRKEMDASGQRVSIIK